VPLAGNENRGAAVDVASGAAARPHESDGLAAEAVEMLTEEAAGEKGVAAGCCVWPKPKPCVWPMGAAGADPPNEKDGVAAEEETRRLSVRALRARHACAGEGAEGCDCGPKKDADMDGTGAPKGEGEAPKALVVGPPKEKARLRAAVSSLGAAVQFLKEERRAFE